MKDLGENLGEAVVLTCLLKPVSKAFQRNRDNPARQQKLQLRCGRLDSEVEHAVPTLLQTMSTVAAEKKRVDSASIDSSLCWGGDDVTQVESRVIQSNYFRLATARNANR